MSEKIILPESDEAAQPYTMTGWKSSNGMFYNDERTARYAGATHIKCKYCDGVAEKPYTACDKCRAKIELEKYLALPSAKWDGVTMLYSDSHDKYYNSLDDVYDEADVDGDLSEFRLLICVPNYVRPLESDYCCDEMTEDGDLPNAVEEAMDAFNKTVEGIILSWSPGKVRVEI